MSKIFIAIILFFISVQPAAANAEENQRPDMIFSQSAILMDTETGTILYSKYGNRKMPPASITKVATAIYAIENSDLNSMVTISKEAAETEGSSVYLLEDEQMTLQQLLTGMMINSGNDASTAIAEHIDGSVEEFSKNLNEFLTEKTGVKNSHFTNPHGLYEEEHFTTAEDMAKITSYAMKNETFRNLFSLKEFDWKGEGWETTLFNHHKMVKGEWDYPEVTGGKNGYVDESKHTLITTASNENLSVAVVLLGAQSKRAVYHDTAALLDYGLNQFQHSVIPRGERYDFEGQTFITDKQIVYTAPINEEAEVSISPSGKLVFSFDGQQQILSQLPDAVSELPDKKEPESETEETAGIVKSQLVLYPVYLYVGILIIALTAVIRGKKTAG